MSKVQMICCCYYFCCIFFHLFFFLSTRECECVCVAQILLHRFYLHCMTLTICNEFDHIFEYHYVLILVAWKLCEFFCCCKKFTLALNQNLYRFIFKYQHFSWSSCVTLINNTQHVDWFLGIVSSNTLFFRIRASITNVYSPKIPIWHRKWR